MTDRNELERLLATIDAAKRLVYGLPVAAIRSDTHGNKMALWCDNGLAGVGQVCVAVNVGEFPDEQLTGIATLANCAIALRNNAQHYLSLVEENARLRRERYDICQNKRINDAIQTALEKGEITLCGEGYMIPLGEPK